MKTFTQTTFVRVEDPVQRKELSEWLEAIGYEFGYGAYDDSYPIVISYAHINQYLYSEEGPDRDVSIDCGTNIEMFKALAALRDDSDYLQWFVCQKDKGDNKSFVQCTVDNITKWYYMRSYYICRKATPAEIVEHFKEQTQ